MGTPGSIAQGLASNLIERAADVVLKEGRKLVLVPRENAFSAIFISRTCCACRGAGAVILPPNPGFYHHPKSIEEVVDFCRCTASLTKWPFLTR